MSNDNTLDQTRKGQLIGAFIGAGLGGAAAGYTFAPEYAKEMATFGGALLSTGVSVGIAAAVTFYHDVKGTFRSESNDIQPATPEV